MWHHFIFRLALIGILCVGSAHAEQAEGDDAHFEVTPVVINPDLQPFTATIDAFGNGHWLGPRGSFEPRVFRTMIQAAEDAENRIVAPFAYTSHYDSWRSGALDGAEVEVLRIENGAFRSIRHGRIPPGGHQSSGWRRATPSDKIVPADKTSYTVTLQRYNRPNAPYYFTVRAVSPLGFLSKPAQAVHVMAPERLSGKPPQTPNRLTAAKFRNKTGWIKAPEQLSASVNDGGHIALTWSAVPGATGYIVYRSDDPPSAHAGSYIELDGTGPPIKAGDLAIIRTKFYDAMREKRLSNRVWSAWDGGRPFKIPLLPWSDISGSPSWELVKHTKESAVEDPGETYLRVQLAAEERFTLHFKNHAGTVQDWYPVLDPDRTYRVDVWMRADAPKTVTFQASGPYSKRGRRIGPIRFAVTQSWQRFEATFKVPYLHTGQGVGTTFLQLDGPGIFEIDNFRVYADDAPYLAFDAADMARLERSGMAALRTHGFIKTGHRAYDLQELTNPAGVSNIKGGNTLPQTLTQIARVGMHPWLQIEPHFSRDEWLGLAEYLAAPFDPQSHSATARPFAAKRFAQGDAPWTEQFDKIFFEVGNETWNRMFAPWVFPEMRDSVTGQSYGRGTVYGLYQEYVLSILRDSPYWPALAPKLTPVIGGWSGFDFGIHAMAASPNTPYLTHAAYNGGWEENAGIAAPTPEGFFSILTHTLQSGAARADKYQNAAGQISEHQDRTVFTGTYEAGPGYLLNGLNGHRVSRDQAALQERAMKSVAAGTATLDAFLTRAERGQVLQNFFTYGSGPYWTSHARWDKGGQSYPAWDLLSLFNREALGDMLKVETVAVTTKDLHPKGRRPAVADAPLVTAYATRFEDRLAVIVMSRHVPRVTLAEGETTSVRIDLPISSAQRLTRYEQSGTLDSHNVDQRGSEILEQVQGVPSTLPRLLIPALAPGKTLIYVFDEVS